MKRLNLQPGLGDAIYALPFICEMVKTEEVEFHTKWPEVFQDVKGVSISKEPLAIRLGDIRFQWTNVSRKSFVQMYEEQSEVKGDYNAARLALSFGLTEQHKQLFARADVTGKDLCIIGEPRAAGRHKDKNDMSCCASPYEMGEWIEKNREKYYYVSVGKDEKFVEPYRLAADEDLNNKLSLMELITLFRCVELCASQVSYFVPLACLFDIPMKLFKAASQTEDEFKEHVRRTVYEPELLI